MADVQEWREDAQDLLVSHERRLQKLRSEVRATRLLLDVFLLLLLGLAAAWYYGTRLAVP